jgi:hypothetical protein
LLKQKSADQIGGNLVLHGNNAAENQLFRRAKANENQIGSLEISRSRSNCHDSAGMSAAVCTEPAETRGL